ncbi:type II toxin-antitoxin system VapC family toxin [Wenzhouxiangella sp. XN79A]|nr:type II toxin-antitoxin system VapC family toxin [Wenzhouxiangella sp. XN79A]
MKYLLDSVILIDHFNGIASATTFVSDHAAACALSVITRAEVLTGFSKESEPLALAVLNAFPTLPLTTEIADSAARLRRIQRWKLPDAIQAAFAKHHDLTLVTRNTRDFQDGDEVAVLVPYRL